jgi:hypothetical protein
MAQHIRQAIREAIATAITGLAATGSRVFQSRAYAVAASELPCLLVYTLAEDVTKPVFCHPGEVNRLIQVSIDGIKTATEDLDDDLDNIAAQVEQALALDFTLGGLAKDLQLVRTELQIQGGDSPKPMGIIRMTWAIRVATLEGIPGTAL